MEEELKSLSKSLGGFCNHLQSSCDAFNHSLQRRPIPLDSASSTFIKGLNRRISTAASELSFLESMSFGTVSFEELLGHCSQIYKNNQKDLLHLQDRLTDFGYVPEIEIDEGRDEESVFGAFGHEASKHSDDDLESHSLQCSIKKGLDEDNLLDNSLNLKNLGLSDACLAYLATGVNDNVKDPDTSLKESVKGKSFDTRALPAPNASELSNEDEYATLEMDKTSGPTLTLIKEEYDSLPSFMKSLASWEDLLSAVQKFNSVLDSKKEINGSYYFRADEIPTLGLGHKEKAYTLLLTRMKRLVVETTDGVISYRVA
ncbi:hypothetical protein AtNW77_Chr5g0089831 [Arabidopsis thaliana]|uniref:Uncharacterized protein n=4 Tax=Arabidopsis TaxID=3701 RepID=A0A178UL20_ARATH|nr:uncharacterized protein AT5G06590 [Arabidopsis thaliana]KAG7601408.1 hypothetical protein ISN45_At05g005810 [Arabidopsis thaliana x Arabidopsis arenosa]KAG7608346.1 hypothetical protein ISN44_As05g005820 [Arabidopsis suecica]AAP04081.1 unknown protein [Arabidopsis thaliana]AED91038.1 hypothetical protein AT5G06590 [Arabidopsis thaliana]OAO93997.1 hypothetical protein AXX17_AT5G06180 [Arabidopsis thaliana]|eukprot:NP_196277.2 hypothetical protein AT5G06590 [Arabidopsis thaliana]